MKTWMLLIVFCFTMAQAQELVTSLNGFQLGQFRRVPQNEYTSMIQKEKYNDGFEMEAFRIEDDPPVQMTFEYAYYDLERIHSIELTGQRNGFICHFKEMTLGMSAREIEEKIGAPTTIQDNGENGKKWIYTGTNYTLTFDYAGKLRGVKITDLSQKFYPETQLSKIPSLSHISEIFKSGDREKISGLLAPDIRLSANGTEKSFQYRLSREVKNDESRIFKIMESLVPSFEKIDPENPSHYEENVELTLGAAPMPVITIKPNGKTLEIVFKHLFGKYLISIIEVKGTSK